MDLLRKTASVAVSVALLGSLVATVASPLALASTNVVSAGSIPLGGTSTGAATFVFTENSATAFSGPGWLTVVVRDRVGGNTLTLGGGALSAPGSLGASLSVSGNSFTVTTTSADPVSIESITVAEITISASDDAAMGDVQAFLGGSLTPAVTEPGQISVSSPGTVVRNTHAGAVVARLAIEARVAETDTPLPPDWTGDPITRWRVYVSENVVRVDNGPASHHRTLTVGKSETWCEGTAPRTCYSRELLTATGTDWEFAMDAAARSAHLVGTVEVHEASGVRPAMIEVSWAATDTFHGVGGVRRTEDPPGTSFYKVTLWDNNATVVMTFDGAPVEGQRGILAVWRTMDVSVRT